jgi:hypothetical protein
MRIRKHLADGRVLEYGGRNRYAVYRMTMHPYSVTGGGSAEDAVQWARERHAMRGWDYLVLDTTTGEIIATYPISLKERIDGKSANKGREAERG